MTRRLIFLLLALTMTCVVWAGPNDGDYARLARLSYMEGHISFQHVADVEWSAASINLPLEPGDRIYTGPDGRAEIEFDDGSTYRLARNTDVELLSLKEDLIQVRILVGLSTLNVFGDTDFEMDTPAAAFNTLRKGIYRFNVGESGDSEAVVRKGRLEAANNYFSRRIDSGEMLRVASSENGNPDFARYDRRDEWDEWNDRRDADLYAYDSSAYLPDNVYMGASELQQYGHWIDDATYGSAWVPYYVDVSWSPYSVGRWCYRPVFGWTWISYEPWGWLPYHYGRWYHSPAYGWCWLPGPSFAFAFWSPGLVAFYNGPGWISWCPLGPGDYYNINNYYYNRGIYSYQLEKLRHLSARAPGDLFHRNEHGAFRTVSTDQFRDGAVGRGRSNDFEKIDQPWKRGVLVSDRLNVQPTARSFKAAPDRQAIQPSGRARALPSVVRYSPAVNLRGQEQFTRITNPKIPALPSRLERMQSEPGTPDTGNASRSGMRGNEGRQAERPNPEAQNPADAAPAGRGGARIITTPRTAGAPGGNAGNPGTGASSTPSARPDSNPPTTQRTAPVWRYDGRPPQQQQAPRAPAEAAPRNDGQQQNNRGESRSDDGRRSGSNGQRITVPAPRTDNPPPYVAPKPSTPSNERNGGARVYSAPSGNPSGREQAPSSSGRSAAGGTPSRDNGGGAKKAPERGSSDSGGSRR